MRRWRTAQFGVLLSSCLVVAACAVDVDVDAERADRIGGELRPESGPIFGDDAVVGEQSSGEQSSSESSSEPVDGSTMLWSGCATFNIPPVEYLETDGWECASLTVAMDPLGATNNVGDVRLAVTRHRATGVRRGSLLLNPGGPGASGLELVWGLRSNLPASVLRAFDIVSWDPRGVGQSRPAITCGVDPDYNADDLMWDCAESTGELAAYLAAPYSAADMEAIRIALGEDRLNFVGYSYGTMLGASYAASYPSTVGRFVLDGATDPMIGSLAGTFVDGFPRFADDGVPAATARFEALCDLSERCALGDDSAAALDDLFDSVDGLPTSDFEFEPQTVGEDVFAELFRSALGFAGDWELLSTALSDARRGDASALAALAAVEPGISSETLGEDASSFELANLVIYCADFAHVITEWTYCDGLPRNEFPLVPVVAVDIDEPILVIGTTYDPSTPGKHASEFAEQLGDAVHILWDGVGHTAFPAPTACIDDAVSDYLIDGVIPAASTTCAFLQNVANDVELADRLFGHDGIESERQLIRALESRSRREAQTARCVAMNLNELDDQIISHVVLGVTSDQAESAIADAVADC